MRWGLAYRIKQHLLYYMVRSLPIKFTISQRYAAGLLGRVHHSRELLFAYQGLFAYKSLCGVAHIGPHAARDGYCCTCKLHLPGTNTRTCIFVVCSSFWIVVFVLILAYV